jgi:Na+-transporting NADH:ubiquinone oxidoreductase subunit NqrB
MAIGAGLASIKAFGMLARGVIGNSSPEPFAIQAFATLFVGGALAGAVFTALGPLHRRSSFWDYVAWILTVYVLLAVVVGVGTLVFGDDPALLKEPAILTFLFGSGAVLGVFWARVVRRWSSGDFS